MGKNFFKSFVLLVATMGLLCGCNVQNNNSGTSSEEIVDKQEPVESELPESINAELGEKCNIPLFSVTVGGKDIEVSITVKDSKGDTVNLLGRGTRFLVEQNSDYSIIYSYTHNGQTITHTVIVHVVDTSGPEIKLPASAYGMSVELNDVVTLPVAEVTDACGEIDSVSVSVTRNGQPVQVIANKFTASAYGDYLVKYVASDIYGNISEKTITIECAKKILLEGFEDYTSAWADQSVSEITTEHAKHGNCMRINSTNSWTLLAVYPKYYDLSGFDKLTLSVYSDSPLDSSDNGVYLLNQRYTIDEGENTIVISKDDLNGMYPGGTIPSENPRYYDQNYLWFQIRCQSSANVWVDDFYGVFKVTETDVSRPTIDVGRAAPHLKMKINEGFKLLVPAATAYDDSLETINVTHKVFKKDNTEVTNAVDNGTYVAERGEEYSIVYYATDAAGNSNSKTIKTTVVDKCDLPDISAEEYFPTNKEYDMLQDFEDTGVDFTVITTEYVAEHNLSGDKAVMFSTTAADTCNVIKLVRDGSVLSEEMWSEYEYIQAYVYCDTLNSRFDFYGHVFPLQPGPNVLQISSADLIAEIKKASNVYDIYGGFYCQVTNGTMYIDAIIGVYPEGYHKKSFLETYLGDSYDMLQDFEGSGVKGVAAATTCEYVTNHALTGDKAAKIVTDEQWQKADIFMLKDDNPLTMTDFQNYKEIKVYVYSEANGARLCFLNKIYELSKGVNVVAISSSDIIAQINSNVDCYTPDGAFWFQVCTGTIYLDTIIGTY